MTDEPRSDCERAFSILAIAGSLRRASHNRTLLRAVSQLAPESVTVIVYEGLEAVPVFNEDLEGTEHDPPGVIDLRLALSQSDGLLIATPEYNQSVPGVVKNMIDWLSRGGHDQGLAGRPVAVTGASTGPWGTRIAQTLLRQMLLSVQAYVMPDPTVFIPNVEALLDVHGELADSETRQRLQTFVTSFTDWISLVSPRREMAEVGCGVEAEAPADRRLFARDRE